MGSSTSEYEGLCNQTKNQGGPHSERFMHLGIDRCLEHTVFHTHIVYEYTAYPGRNLANFH